MLVITICGEVNMKRIFEVNGKFFATKQEAKVERGERVDSGNKADAPTYSATISKGPDHWKSQKITRKKR